MSGVGRAVEEAVECICALGCRQVSAYIRALQAGESRPEYQSLDSVQRVSLLHELRAIMAVYDQEGDE
ncbi:MAG TPA: hypothetical protein ENJ80_06915 [Gammaproteobacteria bacterium]|nr:hypothetical protein [Gammaproteobacteria bacterium]